MVNATRPVRQSGAKVCGGQLEFWVHASEQCHAPMHFSTFVPQLGAREKLPVLYWLSGLTCSEENFMVKSGAQRMAAELGLILVAPDTSPRKTGIAGEDDDWDFGSGAGFYVDATQEPWLHHYRMYSYVTRELPSLIEAGFPVRPGCASVFGHSMGGHGALVCALRNPEQFRSVSAFAPICAPIQCPWGRKAFAGYLGSDANAWEAYDASLLVMETAWDKPILVDQGTADPFLDEQLMPGALAHACRERGLQLEMNLREGYDHSYYFIASFIENHMRFHAKALSVG